MPQLGRYDLLFRIGSGGMAEVFAAVANGQEGIEKLVAIKRMQPFLQHDRDMLQMFREEAQLASGIHSPHVIETLELGVGDDGQPYIVMELVVGASLKELCERAPPAASTALAWLAQTAEGLSAAHEARGAMGDPLGLVHRDVCPHNILLGVDGRARLSDFGIARARHASGEADAEGDVKGKFRYISPEIASGAAFDHRTDIFSLGVVAWELLAGDTLFARDSPDAVLRAVRGAAIPRVDEWVPTLGREVGDCVERCLRRTPSERYGSARELAAALRGAGQALGTPPSLEDLGRVVSESGSEKVAAMLEALEAHVPGGRITLENLGTVSGPSAQASLRPPQG